MFLFIHILCFKIAMLKTDQQRWNDILIHFICESNTGISMQRARSIFPLRVEKCPQLLKNRDTCLVTEGILWMTSAVLEF